MTNQPKKRDSKIELLRIVLIGMIVLFHLVIHGCGLSKLSTNEYISSSNNILYLLIVSFSVIGVNGFILISGYYGIQFKFKKLLSFVIQAVFYSVTIYLLTVLWGVFHNQPTWSFIEFFKSFLPITAGKWWFLTVYIGLYLFSPLLNKGLESINKWQLLLFIAGGGYFGSLYILTGSGLFGSSGHTIFSFILIYCIGYYLRKYVKKIRFAFVGYILISLLFFIGVFLAYGHVSQQFIWALFSYSNPILILSSIFLFFAFKNLKLKPNSLINAISPLVLGVYLIHDQPNVREWLSRITETKSNLTTNSISCFFLLLGMMVLILFTCFIIEKVRQLICTPLQAKLFESKLVTKIALKTDCKEIDQ